MRFEWRIGPCSQGDIFDVEAKDNDTYPNGAYLSIGGEIDETFSVFLSTDQMRELAAKINEAADAFDKARAR